MDDAPEQRRAADLAAGAALLVTSLLAFSPAIDGGFLNWDDEINVTANPHLRPLTLENLSWYWRQFQTPYGGLYVPATYNLLALEAKVAACPISAERPHGLDPRIFHLTNVLLHGLCAALVYTLLHRARAAPWASCAGALVFAVHPLHVEPVAWITGVKDLLSSLLVLFALLLATGDWRLDRVSLAWRIVRLIGATSLYALALTAKPAAIAGALLLPIIDRLQSGRWRYQSGIAAIVWATVGGVFVIASKWAQPDHAIGFVPDWWQRPLVAADAAAFYVVKLILPVGLCADYGRSPEYVCQSNWLYLAWLLPVLVLAIGIWARRGTSHWLAAALVFFIACSPTLGIVPFGFQRFSTVADRYAYLALLGPAYFLSQVLPRRASWPSALFASALIVLLAAVSWQQSHVWRSDATLWGHTARNNARSYLALNNLGYVRQLEGDSPSAQRLYEAALAIEPQYADALNNLGNLQYARQMISEAIALYRQALEADPVHAQAHYNLANALRSLGQLGEAALHYERAAQIRPAYWKALLSLASVRLELGQTVAAKESFERALQIVPEFAAAHFALAGVLVQLDDLPGAAEHLRAALRLDPSMTAAGELLRDVERGLRH